MTKNFNDKDFEQALAEQPAQQEPVAFPNRYLVEREIERAINHTGMHLNDGKERVTLPSGTLRYMLALIDRTSPPAQRTWVGLSDLDIDELENEYMKSAQTAHQFLRAIEAKLRSKNNAM